MDSFAFPHTQLLPILLVFCYLPFVYTSNLDHNQLLIYNHCDNQTSVGRNTGSVSSVLSELFQELQEKSAKSKFFEIIAGNEKMAVSGLFQCRGDLTNDDCYSCVKRLPEVSSSLCGESLPTRIQLAGCRIHYQAEGVETNRLQVLHKSCSDNQGYSGFQANRDDAFAAVQNCILTGKGFCDEICEFVHVTAQCDGNLEACDCGKCFSVAVQIAQEECGYSAAGEIYLDGCYLSYGYQNYGGYYNSEDGSQGSSSNKLVAIVIGGIFVVLLGAGLCYFCLRLRRSKDDY